MKSQETAQVENLTLKLLSLSQDEVEELFTFLFRKLHFRVEKAAREEDLLYLHLVSQTEENSHHALACWTGGKRILAIDFLQSFLKTPPFPLPPEITFEKGFFLSPYKFGADFKEEAEKNKISLLSGENLAELLVQNNLTYYFPSFLQAVGKLLWKKLPLIITPLLLLYGFFMIQTLRPHHESVIHEPSNNSEPSSHQEVSLLTPSFAVNIEKPNELYKRIDLNEAPVSKPQPPRKSELPEHPPSLIEVQPEPGPSPPPAPAKPVPLQHPKPNKLKSASPHPTPSNSENPYRVINKYNKVVDLEQKYYLTARDLEKRHFNGKAKAYYQKYLRVAPEGDFAEEARAALKRL